ncbi:MAG: glutaredoxin family protein [Gaiellales bacterium]
MRRVEVLVASGCMLCPAAIAAAETACAGRTDVTLTTTDIDGDLELERRWRAAIPVVLVDDVEVGRYVVTAGEIVAGLDG